MGDGAGEMGDNLPYVDLGEGFNPIQIVSGHYFNCAIHEDRIAVKCWGENNKGTLGIESTEDKGAQPGHMGGSLMATKLQADDAPGVITRLFAQGDYACAIRTTEAAGDETEFVCWGGNSQCKGNVQGSISRFSGQRAGTMGKDLKPQKMPDDYQVKHLALSAYLTCAIVAHDDTPAINRLVCWGRQPFTDNSYQCNKRNSAPDFFDIGASSSDVQPVKVSSGEKHIFVTSSDWLA